ncbi:MAG: hypothetical protein ACOC38_04850 [Promethearchaeia archaeon]
MSRTVSVVDGKHPLVLETPSSINMSGEAREREESYSSERGQSPC